MNYSGTLASRVLDRIRTREERNNLVFQWTQQQHENNERDGTKSEDKKRRKSNREKSRYPVTLRRLRMTVESGVLSMTML